MSVSLQRGGLAFVAAAMLLLLPAATLSQDTAPEPLPEPGTPLEPGRYASDAVGPAIDFRVGEGWLAGPSGDGPIFTLERTDPPGAVVSVTRFDGEAFLDSCDASSMTIVEPSVGRLAEIIAGNPYLNPGTPSPIEVDGHSGLQLDIGVPAYSECQLPFLLIWAVPIGSGGEFVQVADQQSRFILLDVEGDVIIIAIESFPGVPFGGLLDATMELVGSLRQAPGEYLPPRASTCRRIRRPRRGHPPARVNQRRLGRAHSRTPRRRPAPSPPEAAPRRTSDPDGAPMVVPTLGPNVRPA